MEAPEWCDGMVTGSTVLHRLPAAAALAAQQCLQAISAAALPTGSAHPQHADRRAQVVRERRQVGGWCFGWDTFALASSATKATAESRGACEVGSAWSQQEFRMSPGLNHQHVPHSSLGCLSCWSVANMLSSLKILRKVKEQGFNIKCLNQSRVEFPRAKILLYPEGIPSAEYKYPPPKNGGVIRFQRRVTRILCKGKG